MQAFAYEASLKWDRTTRLGSQSGVPVLHAYILNLAPIG